MKPARSIKQIIQDFSGGRDTSGQKTLIYTKNYANLTARLNYVTLRIDTVQNSVGKVTDVSCNDE
jgi:hypothetical protein